MTKTLPVKIRTEMHLAQHMYNIIKLPSPSFLTTIIEHASHSSETRAREKKNLKLKKPRTESLRKTALINYNSRRKSKTFISRDLCSRLPEIVLYH